MGKCLLIGRHKLLPAQERDILEKLKCEDLIRVPHVGDIVRDVIERAKSEGVDKIIVQALPLSLMAQLLTHRERPDVYFLKMEGRGVVDSEEEAKEWVGQASDRRIYLPPPPTGGGYRLVEYVGLFKQKRIVIEEEPIDC